MSITNIYRDMNRGIIRTLKRSLLIMLFMLAVGNAWAQDPIDSSTTREILTIIEEASADWDRIELNGKIKTSMLPVSPSVKVYMERDIKVEISVRVPLLGEVLRIQATNDTIIGINKMKRTYWSESVRKISGKYPGTLELIQSVLLGRMVIFGQGPVSAEMAEILNLFPDGEDGWLLMPNQNCQPAGFRYGYVAGEEGEMLALIVERNDNEDFLQVDYDWRNNGKYDLEMQLGINGKEYDGRLELDTPKVDPLPMNPVAVDQRYRKVTFKEFITKII